MSDIFYSSFWSSELQQEIITNFRLVMYVAIKLGASEKFNVMSHRKMATMIKLSVITGLTSVGGVCMRR